MGQPRFGIDAFAQDANSIRQAYGSVGTTATDVSLSVVARTETAVNAKSLGDTLNSLKQIAFFAIMNMSGDRRALAQSALANLTINSRANEVEDSHQGRRRQSRIAHQIICPERTLKKDHTRPTSLCLTEKARHGGFPIIAAKSSCCFSIPATKLQSVRARCVPCAIVGTTTWRPARKSSASRLTASNLTQKFAEHHSLPLRLLSDADRKVAGMYGANRSCRAKSRARFL